MVEIIHNSHDERYRFPFGAVEKGRDVYLSLAIKTEKEIDCAEVIINKEEDQVKQKLDFDYEKDGQKVYSRKLYTSSFKGIIWYYFEVKISGKTYYYGNNREKLGGKGKIYNNSPYSFQITVHERNIENPSWYKEGIIYQIFPDRFYNGNEFGKVNRPNRDMVLRSGWSDSPHYVKDTNGGISYYDYFGGNLLGIEKKLGYLSDLGVNIIYLNPIFEAGSNHKYDIGDYLKVDKMFGTEEDFKRLCEKAKEYGIHIVLDGVFNHTGSDSIYFNKYGRYDSIGAYQSKTSKYHDWYFFEEYPDRYKSWWGIDVLPNVNEDNEDFRELILGSGGVIEKWIKLGASGWRLDVADELTDRFIRDIRKKLMNVKEDAILIGEVWEDASNKVSYGEQRKYLLGDELSSTMNYPFKEIFIDFILGNIGAYDVHRRAMSLCENYPSEYFYSAMNLIGTHDSKRVIYSLADIPTSDKLSDDEKRDFILDEYRKKKAIEKLKLLISVQMTFPGVPSIYYGDEVGLEGYEDPYNRRTYPWDGGNYEIFDWYKEHIEIRNEYDEFRNGDFESIPIDEDVYCFKRIGDSLALVVINRSEEEKEIELELSSDYKFKDLLSKENIETYEKKLEMILKPKTSYILIG